MRHAPLLVLVLLGCSYFPSHEEVFIPVPLAVGEARVVGGDTSWVLAGSGWELVAPEQALLPDAQRALEDAHDIFRRVFGAEPRRVVVVLRDLEARGDADSVAAARAAAGADVVSLPLPPRRVRERGLLPAPGVSLTPVARVWLRGYVDARAAAPALRRSFAPEPPTADDPRLPDWLEDGIVQVVAASPYQELALVQAERHRDRLLPLRELVVARRPAAPRGQGVYSEAAPEDPARLRALWTGTPSEARLFAMQSYALARFIAEREGEPFLGRITDRILAGDAFAAALASARHLPDDLEALEAEWRRWLAEEGGARR